MRGSQRLRHVESSTPRMERALPDLPMASTVMVRLLRIGVFGMSDFFEPVFRAVGLTDNSFHVRRPKARTRRVNSVRWSAPAAPI